MLKQEGHPSFLGGSSGEGRDQLPVPGVLGPATYLAGEVNRSANSWPGGGGGQVAQSETLSFLVLRMWLVNV